MEKIEKFLNASLNVTLLFVGGFQIAFSDVFGNVVNKIGENLSQSLSDSAKVKDNTDFLKKSMTKEVVKMLHEIAGGVKSSMTGKVIEDMKKIITEKDCDDVIKIVEKYKFGLPLLTEELSDEAIIGYLCLAAKQNEKYQKMMEELMVLNEKFQKKLGK